MGHESHHYFDFNVLLKTIGALLVLTVLTVGASQVHLGSHLINTLVALGIATVKAYFVGANFMGLKHDDRLHSILLFSSIGFVILLYLFSIMDIYTRIPVHSTL